MQAGMGSPGRCIQTNLRGNLCPTSDSPQEAILPFGVSVSYSVKWERGSHYLTVSLGDTHATHVWVASTGPGTEPGTYLRSEWKVALQVVLVHSYGFWFPRSGTSWYRLGHRLSSYLIACKAHVFTFRCSAIWGCLTITSMSWFNHQHSFFLEIHLTMDGISGSFDPLTGDSLSVFGRLVDEASELRALLLLSFRGCLFSGIEGIACYVCSFWSC